MQKANHFKTNWRKHPLFRNIVQKSNHFRTIISKTLPNHNERGNGNKKQFHPVGKVLHQGSLQLDIINSEECPSHTKIKKFIDAVKCHFENPTRGRKSRRQPRRKAHIIGQGAHSLRIEYKNTAVSQRADQMTGNHAYQRPPAAGIEVPTPIPMDVAIPATKNFPRDTSQSPHMDYNALQIEYCANALQSELPKQHYANRRSHIHWKTLSLFRL